MTTIETDVPSGLGPYRLRQQIGEGASSRVFEAEDLRDGASVAIKLYHAYQRSTGFVREAGVGLDVRHPNLMQVKDVGYLDEGCHYVAYPLARGGSLRQRLDGAPLPASFVRHVVVQIARALGALHRQAIVHRDLKPDNVLLDDDGPFPQLKLGDLGSCFVVRRESAQGDTGSPAYMAPEQIDGSCDTRADIYALGVMTYEMLAGERPFTGSIRSIAEGHLEGRADMSRFSPAVTGVLERAMAKRPEDRQASAYAFARDLDLALSTADAPWVEQIDIAVARGAYHGDRCVDWEIWRDGPSLQTRGKGAPGPLPLVEGRVAAELCASHPAVIALRDSRQLQLGAGWSQQCVPLPLYGLPPLVAIQRYAGRVATVSGGRKLQVQVLGHDGVVVESLPLPFPLCLLASVPGPGREVLLGVDIQRERMIIWDDAHPHGDMVMLPDRILAVTIVGATVTLRFAGNREQRLDCLVPRPTLSRGGSR